MYKIKLLLCEIKVVLLMLAFAVANSLEDKWLALSCAACFFFGFMDFLKLQKERPKSKSRNKQANSQISQQKLQYIITGLDGKNVIVDKLYDSDEFPKMLSIGGRYVVFCHKISQSRAVYAPAEYKTSKDTTCDK